MRFRSRYQFRTDLAHWHLSRAWFYHLPSADAFPHLSAQLGGCEDTEILKRRHLLRDTRTGSTLALRVLSPGEPGEVGHYASGHPVDR